MENIIPTPNPIINPKYIVILGNRAPAVIKSVPEGFNKDSESHQMNTTNNTTKLIYIYKKQ